MGARATARRGLATHAPRELTRAAAGPARFIEPMRCRLVAALPPGEGWDYEIKWDGYRAVAIRSGRDVALLSRNGRPLTSRFPSLVAALRPLGAESVVDGEIVAFAADGRPSFNTLQQHGSPIDAPVVFYAFDLLVDRGESLLASPLSARRVRLRRALRGCRDPIRISEPFAAAVDDIVAAARREGIEGIVAKRRDSLYLPGKRPGTWLKQKLDRGQELVIGGYVRGGALFDALLVGYYDDRGLQFVAKIRNGFVPETKQRVHARMKPLKTDRCPFANLPEPRNARRGLALTAEGMQQCTWVRPKLVAQIEFTEWTAAGHLRHARFAGLRDDKRARDVRREDQSGCRAASDRSN